MASFTLCGSPKPYPMTQAASRNQDARSALWKYSLVGGAEHRRARLATGDPKAADWVVDELRKIAGANMADYLKSTTHGDPG